ncbi:anthranilate synthase component I [Heyndrickxia acidicola]|uniref:Anthranilate synthase component 1 n=1 Tax=Heyndrickxia acidicola TaxID=209389 RepID=A0ABU6MP33_9BACI|nr:anthranilate synthase component I [Heyndrickxia acidicola]MED1204992.1 anthranilate synthase component I [Heyndrickxia acidicola]
MTQTQHTQYKILKLNGDTLTPITVFNRLRGRKKCLLESSLKHQENGRYSFISLNPIKEIKGDMNGITILDHTDGSIQIAKGLPHEVIQAHLPHQELDLPFPFYGGFIGYLGYDVIRQYENIGRTPHDELGIPDFHVSLYQDVIVFDHEHLTIYLIALNGSESELETRLSALKEMIYTNKKDEEDLENSIMAFKPAIEKKDFVNMVETAKKHIEQGDIFQIVLSQRLKSEMNTDPFHFYRKLRKANPSPYMFYMDYEDHVLLGASPESLIKTKGRTVITNPIAGTRARGVTMEEDQKLAKELLEDEKELAEHKMLVDLSRNDLGRVCEPGSIEVSKYMEIERYQHVMHIVSEVQGTLHEEYTGLNALISCLPAGTVSGAPKIRAMQIINDLETVKRNAYAGAIGYINVNGDVDFALAIRSLVVKDGYAYVQAGAGIVYDSVPELEYAETLNKAKSLLEVHINDLTVR